MRSGPLPGFYMSVLRDSNLFIEFMAFRRKSNLLSISGTFSDVIVAIIVKKYTTSGRDNPVPDEAISTSIDSANQIDI